MSHTTEKPSIPKLLLSRADLKSMGIIYSNAHLLRLEAAEKFPVRVRLSPGRVAWLQVEIVKFIADRAADRINGSAEE